MKISNTNDLASESIAGLIDSFFDALRVSSEASEPEARPAELAYELDQVVSSYLEDNALSPDAYQAIQQDVLNTIAQDLQDQFIDDAELAFSQDASGNVDGSEVLVALDIHYDDLVSLDPSTDVAALDADAGLN